MLFYSFHATNIAERSHTSKYIQTFLSTRMMTVPSPRLKLHKCQYGVATT